MSDSGTLIRAYIGPPDAAWIAFQRDEHELRAKPVAVTWTGLHLVVVWEKTGSSVPLRLGEGIRAVASLAAMALFGFAGLHLISLRSVGGNSVAEFFYQGVGWLSFGLAALTMAVGFRR